MALIGVGAVGMGRRLAKSSAREQALPRSSFSRRTPCHVLAFIGPPKEFPCRSIGLQLLPEFLDFCAEECPERSSTNKQASPAWTDVHNFLARPKKVYPVSYTHLDVYKRQPSGLIENASDRLFSLSSAAA